MFRKLIFCSYRLPFNRSSNLRIILSILLLLCLIFIIRIWSNKIYFREYKYLFDFETILERRSSQFHNITIAQSGSLRMIRFDMLDIQGIVHLEKPYVILFDYMRLQLLCLLWNSEPDRILIIGLGAGILPKAFHYLSENTLIDIVEIDSAVVELSRKYFNLKENSYIRIFIEDGRHFIERQPSNQYDVIIIDVSIINGHIPYTLRTLECVGEYLRILKSNGLVLSNFAYNQESRYRETYSRALFKHIYRGITKDNYILIGLNKQTKIYNQDELKIRARAYQFSRSLPDTNWMEEIKYIHNGNDDRWNTSAAIFTDKIDEDFRDLSERNSV